MANIFPTPSTGPVLDDNRDTIYSNADYTPILSNWYTSKPYGFRFTPREGEAKVMFLPIGPSNLQITTHFATNFITTIYGVVEEHSPIHHFDIVIEGTTGMGPKYTAPMSSGERPDIKSGTEKTGRTSFTIQTSLSTAAGGFFSKTLSSVDKVISGISDIVGKSAVTGLQLDQTGYIAFHNLYRFFLKYKKDASGTDTSDGSVDASSRDEDAPAPLVFFNYKDNNEYNVVIKSFILRRDKENPMLYYYNITMKGYHLKGVDAANRLDNKSQNEMLEALGLNGVKGSTFLGKAREIASQARGILGSVANGVNQLGR